MKPKTTPIYNENSIVTLNYRDAVRESLGMYIGSNDTNGMHHLLTEIVANSMDEAAAGYGNTVQVIINRDDNSATVIDNGRGIPFKKNDSGNFAIVEMCTNLHSGGKFTGQGNYKSSLGLNGVGATVTNALSTEFSINVWRDGEHCKFEVFDGDHDDPEIKKTTRKLTGSEVRFIPNSEIFGGATWNIDKVKEELQLHALLNNGITFEVIEKDGDKVLQNKKYKYTNGIHDMLKIKTEGMKLLSAPVVHKTRIDDACDVEFAFVYSDKTSENISSFVNGGKTTNHGTHVTGWKTGFTSFINKKGKELGFIKENDKNFGGDLVRSGLVLVLSIKMNERPLFAEQTKQTLNSPTARGFASKAVGQLSIENKILKQIFDKLLIEQKAEEAAQRKREAQEKITKGGKSLNVLKDLPEKLADASDFSDAEIFFCEGDSAAGGAKETKSVGQAVLPLRGKIKNCTTAELDEVIKSDVIKDMLNCLGCGIGDHFNINNLRYKRIIILADGDADGKHIELLIMTLFLHHLPEVVAQGRLFVSVPPLFRTVNGKDIKYWYEDDAEYRKYVRGHKKVAITRFKGVGELNPSELYETCMNPANRKLIQLTTENIAVTMELFDELMGDSALARRKFIQKKKLSSVAGDDDLFEDEGE